MTDTSPLSRRPGLFGTHPLAGPFWLALAVLGAAVFFRDGLSTLLTAWAAPEYSHGPLIPVLSGILFLRQLKDHPAQSAPVTDRGPGVALLILALVLGAGGNLIGIGDIVAYALILWVGAMLLIGFGWRQGRAFWPPVLHLVYMLPLPGVLYYGLSTTLQGLSSELGVWFLRLMQVPVFLDGNIIDLGVTKLHVAEACSGLRYLFPILSFSYIFAVLYRGPMWHKAVLLISAVPITVVMNSVRIAIAGWIVDRWGPAHLQGFTHFFEGWVIFLACVAILFALAWALLFFRRDRLRLAQALDVDLSGLVPQALRLRDTAPSPALILAGGLSLGLAALWAFVPARPPVLVDRAPFALFPTALGGWQAGPPRSLDPDIARMLAADDYHSVTLTKGGEAQSVDLFIAWYKDQMMGGAHSPEVCLPGAGWEIAALDQITATGPDGLPFSLNRALIQNGADRMLVYYWFEQQGRRTASGFAARLQLTLGKITNGRGDSALVRLITPIPRSGGDAGAGAAALAAAEARLQDAMAAILPPLPRFVPGL
jgi:exosortase D (VPLPA-CTERM-specific)